MSNAAFNANSLRTLKALFDEGVLDADEFQSEKRKLLRAAASTPTGPGTTDAPERAMVAGFEACMTKMGAMADALAQFLSTPTEEDPGAKKRTFSNAFVASQPKQPTVWVPDDQPVPMRYKLWMRGLEL